MLEDYYAKPSTIDRIRGSCILAIRRSTPHPINPYTLCANDIEYNSSIYFCW
jgi:hypothetical protein